MNIAYLINQYPKVSHTFIRREILALERQGFTVQRIALRGWSETLPDPLDRDEQRKTRYVLRQGIAGLLPSLARVLASSPRRLFRALLLACRLSRKSDHRWFHHLAYVAEAARIVLWLREAGTHRLHAHFGTNSAEVALYVRCLGGPPYSFTVHGPEEFESPMGLAEKVADASFVATISSYGRSQVYLRCRPVDWPKIEIVRCGIDSSFLGSTVYPATCSNRLICVGRICEAKAQLLLVEATAQLRDRGIHFDLVLAGDGPMRSEVENLIKARGLEEHVRITGWISGERVREEILSARALVLPSFAEGLPIVLMEAMALRKPVLTTYIAGIPELVRAGESGWLFPAGSLQELAAALEDCLSRSSEELERMGEAGHEHVLAAHSIDREAGKLAELFRSSPSASPSRP